MRTQAKRKSHPTESEMELRRHLIRQGDFFDDLRIVKMRLSELIKSLESLERTAEDAFAIRE